MFPLERWRPLTVAAVARLFADAGFDWCLAGGHAIEQFIGRPLRDHEDIDIVIFRDEQQLLHDWLHGWQLYAADPPGTLRPWAAAERLPISIHDIWGHRADADGWQLQIMLQEVDGDRWVYRRDGRIGGSRAAFAERSGDIPIIRPEIQLLYKSHNPRPRDEIDFQACLPHLAPGAKAWLRTQLTAGRPPPGSTVRPAASPQPQINSGVRAHNGVSFTQIKT